MQRHAVRWLKAGEGGAILIAHVPFTPAEEYIQTRNVGD